MYIVSKKKVDHEEGPSVNILFRYILLPIKNKSLSFFLFLLFFFFNKGGMGVQIFSLSTLEYHFLKLSSIFR
jgi:hypothetical protein